MRPYFSGEFKQYCYNALHAVKCEGIKHWSIGEYCFNIHYHDETSEGTRRVSLSFNGVDASCEIDGCHPLPDFVAELADHMINQIMTNDCNDAFAEEWDTEDGIKLRRKLQRWEGFHSSTEVDDPAYTGLIDLMVHDGYLYREKSGIDRQKHYSSQCGRMSPEEVRAWLEENDN